MLKFLELLGIVSKFLDNFLEFILTLLELLSSDEYVPKSSPVDEHPYPQRGYIQRSSMTWLYCHPLRHDATKRHFWDALPTQPQKKGWLSRSRKARNLGQLFPAPQVSTLHQWQHLARLVIRMSINGTISGYPITSSLRSQDYLLHPIPFSSILFLLPSSCSHATGCIRSLLTQQASNHPVAFFKRLPDWHVCAI